MLLVKVNRQYFAKQNVLTPIRAEDLIILFFAREAQLKIN